MSHYSDKVLFLFLAICLFASCEEEVNLLQAAMRKHGNEEIVEDVILRYTDSGKVQVLLKSPLIKRVAGDANSVMQEFPNGIYCEFYDDSSQLKATLTSKYAIRDENKRIMTARQQVKLVSKDGILEGEELIWDEGRQIVYSNKFVKYTRGKEIGTGFFFEADQSFKKIKMRKTEADNIEIPGLGK